MKENELKPCPKCGAKAYIHRDAPDGYFMGYSVGCPKYYINDGVHGISTVDQKENDMERYINPEKIDFRIPYYPDEEGGDALVSLRAVKRCIDATPTADVVEVVRCKDCKYHRDLDGGVKCERLDGLLMTLPNDFCSYGERKE